MLEAYVHKVDNHQETLLDILLLQDLQFQLLPKSYKNGFFAEKE